MIETLALTLVAALILGTVAAWLRLPTLVGYMAAGIVLGPFTPGLTANPAIASELADIGVVLLLFGVGLHFSLPNLLAVKQIAIPVAFLQLIASTALATGASQLLGWSIWQ